MMAIPESLLPLAALAKRDLILNLRTGKAFLGLLAFMLMFGLMAGSSPIILANADMSLTITILVIAVLSVPSAAAGTITLERNSNSFEMLTLTLLRPSGIILAKASAIGVHACLFLAAILPVVAIVYLGAGGTWLQFVLSVLILLAVVASCAIAGVLVGLATDKRGNISGVSLLAAIAALGLPVYLPIVILSLGVSLEVVPLHVMQSIAQSISNVADYIVPFRIIINMFQGGHLWGLQLLSGLLYQAAFSWACFRLALRLLSRPVGDRELPRKARRASRKDPSHRSGLHEALVRHLNDFELKNPILDKELRLGLFARPIRNLFILGGFLIFVGLFHAFLSQFKPSMLPIPAFILLLAALLIPGSGLAAAIAREQEHGDFDFLRMTLLRSSQLFKGKIHAQLLAFIPFAATFALWILATAYRDQRMLAGIAVLIAAGMLTIVSYGCGAFLTLLCRKSASAPAWTLLLLLFAGIGLTLSAAILLVLSGTPSVPKQVILLSPVIPTLILTSEENMDGIVAVWFVNTITFSVLGFAMLAASIRAFGSRRMQTGHAKPPESSTGKEIHE